MSKVGLSNEILCILVAQEAPKQRKVKFEVQKNFLMHGMHEVKRVEALLRYVVNVFCPLKTRFNIKC